MYYMSRPNKITILLLTAVFVCFVILDPNSPINAQSDPVLETPEQYGTNVGFNLRPRWVATTSPYLAITPTPWGKDVTIPGNLYVQYLLATTTLVDNLEAGTATITNLYIGADLFVGGNASTTGELVVDTRNVGDNFDFYNGTFLEHFDAIVQSDGTTASTTLELDGGGDLTTRFSSGYATLDCTPKCVIELTAGSDTSPQGNWIYILQTDPTTLVKSTSAWPITEHIKIGFFHCPSVATIQAEDGCYINQNHNDGAAEVSGQGHFSDVGFKFRTGGADYFSGVSPNASSSTYLAITAGNVEFKSTSGIVLQLHTHTFPAFDTSVDDEVLVKNWNGDNFHNTSNLNDIVADSAGVSTNNKWLNLVVWGVANKTEDSFEPMIINLPSCSYTNQASAEQDISGCDDFTMPREFDIDSSTGFLIARLTIRDQATWTLGSTVDLRGSKPQIAKGGASGVTTNFIDNTWTIEDEADATRIGNFDLGSVTTGNTRTITWPNFNFDFNDWIMPASATVTDSLHVAGDFSVLGTSSVINMTVVNTTSTGSIYATNDLWAGGDLKVAGGGRLEFRYDANNHGYITAVADGKILMIAEAGTDPDIEIRTLRMDNAIVIDDNTQRVGIGTDVPDATLQIAGDLLVDSNATVTNHFEADGTLYVKDDQVGIGTESPDATLDVNGNIFLTADGSVIRFKDPASGSSGGITYLDSGGGDRFGIIFDEDLDLVALANRAANGVVQIRANTGSAGSGGEVTALVVEDDEIQLLPSGGNVGIGTTAPGGDLDIKTSVRSNFVVSAPADRQVQLGFHEGVDAGTLGFNIFYEGVPSSPDNLFQIRHTTNPLMTFDEAGNVGIRIPTTQNVLNIAKAGTVNTEPGIDFFSTVSTDDTTLYNSGRIYSRFETTGFTTGRITIASSASAGNFVDTLTVKNAQVGIGTIEPLVKLHVNMGGSGGFLNLQSESIAEDSNVSLGFSLTTNDANAAKTYIRAFRRASVGINDLLFHVGENDAMMILDSGNVGINVIDPDEKLEVVGNVKVGDELHLDMSDLNQPYHFVPQGTGARMVLQSQNSASNFFWALMTKDGDGTDDISFEMFGMGTPASITNRSRMSLRYENADSNYEITTEADGSGVLGSIELFTEGNANQLVVATNGNVGIGILSPLTKLEVNGTASTSALIVGDGGAIVNGTIVADTVEGANVTSGGNPGHTHTGSSISSLAAGDTTSGRFGNSRLPTTLTGAVNSGGDIQTGGSFKSSGGTSGIGSQSETNITQFDIAIRDGLVTSFNKDASDERAKKDIIDLPSEIISAISKLRPVQYEYIDQDDGKHIGFTAQAVEKIFEEHGLNPKNYAVIQYNEEKDIYSLSYYEFIPGVLAYAQSLEERIEKLESLILNKEILMCELNINE